MTDPLLGTTFARHRVEAVLGQGGMGTVYLATDERLERQVALKVLPAERAADPAFRERFLREGRLLASLHHEHIVTVFEADEWQGQLYLAMRYVAGPDLRSIIERDGPLTPARAVALLGQVADALDTAHAASLVHRDIKPGNILVLPDPDPSAAGHAYLTDFGLTKPAGAATSGLTMAGQFVGTPGYVAPEQIEGKSAVDHRADIYALGCVLYNALTGDIPYPRDSTMAVLWAHVWEPAPRISDRAPELVPFDGVLATALAKEPAKRYQTAGAFAAAAKQALAALGRAHDGATPPPGTHPPVYEHTATDLLRLDGRREEAAVADETARAERESRVRDRSRRRAISWGNWPLVVAGIVVAGLGAGALATILVTALRSGIAGSPGGRVIFSSDLDGPFHLFTVAPDGSDLRRLTAGGSDDVQPKWSSDGDWIVFASYRDGGSGIFIMRSDGTDVRRLAASPGASDNYPFWSRDGAGVLFASDRDARESATGFDLYSVTVEDGRTTRLTSTPELSESQAALSPDGMQIAYIGADAEGRARLYVADADGTNATPITPATGNSGTPAWSPDGSTITFWTDRDGNSEVYAIRPDGTDERNLTRSVGMDDEPAWTVDGRSILLVSDRGGSRQIYRMAPDGSGAAPLVSVGGSSLGPAYGQDVAPAGELATADRGPSNAVIFRDDLSSASSGLPESSGPPLAQIQDGRYRIAGTSSRDIFMPIFENRAHVRLESSVTFAAGSAGFAALACRHEGVLHYLFWFPDGAYWFRRLGFIRHADDRLRRHHCRFGTRLRDPAESRVQRHWG